MGIRTSVCGIWMGMVLVLGLGTVDAQTQKAVADSGAKASSATSVAKAIKKKESTPEQKVFEQSIKAMRAQSGKMNEKFVKTERKREKARKDQEMAGKTPSAFTTKSTGNGGASQADSAGNGKDAKGK